ncbi:MAG: N(4)-(beta-N-acetylglucosaminyl)-L-asparaginase [Chloroflexota bacterium]|nr:N(4)-(beta-N-acetylglucosaminyl)-L-asparaginase [Chloroflexota bacterium]
MRLIGSSNAVVGFADGMAVLKAGGSALDAVVATIRRVEANPDDHSVGYSGLPNLLGEVELDASIMDGSTLASGAVAAMRNYQDAIDAARAVMDSLPHVLIVGRGAEMFAQETGLPRTDLLTPEAREIWETRLDATDAYAVAMRDRAAKLTSDPERPLESHGTVNVIARDAQGNIASGVSTSGWAWKYPGRVGDSPIIGAGNYADQRYGAACCTGRGEMAQRLCTAHSVVTFMRCGLTLDEALTRAAEDLHQLADPFWGEVNIVAMDRDGRHAAASTVPDKTYAAMDETMSEPVLLQRTFVSAP